MNLEHVGLNHPDPVAAADWYSKNLEMKVVRKSGPPLHGHFLADARGKMLVELYQNPKAPVPNYRELDPLVLHLAFCVDNVRGLRERLLQAGATVEGDVTTNEPGDELAMLRDPWGLALQLVKRAAPMM